MLLLSMLIRFLIALPITKMSNARPFTVSYLSPLPPPPPQRAPHPALDKSVHSCYDYLLAGQRKSGQYPFLKEVNGGKPIQWLRCEFDELIDNVTTVVHNALESYDVQAGRHFELIRAGVQAQAWHIEYE